MDEEPSGHVDDAAYYRTVNVVRADEHSAAGRVVWLFRSPQPFLWADMTGVEWRMVLRLRPYKKRRTPVQGVAVQERLFP